MTDQLPQSLPATLKAHASALQPPFSPALHDCIITRLRQEARSGGAAPLAVASPATARGTAFPGGAYRPAWHWPAAAAILALGGAICLMAILKAAHTTTQPPIVINPPAVTPALPSVPSLPPVQALLNSAVDPTRARLQDSKFAYLDHDAKRFTNFVLSQLPGE